MSEATSVQSTIRQAPSLSQEARELALNNLGLVGHSVQQVAARYPRHVDRGDLWSAGVVGLIDAAQRFDPDAGVRFAQYAMIRIRGSIIDSTRARDWAPRSVRRRTRELQAAQDTFLQLHHREATSAELAAALGLDPAEVATRLHDADAASMLQLDQPAPFDGAGASQGSLASHLAEADVRAMPAMALERQERIGTVRSALEHLPAAQRDVLSMYYFDGHLLHQIATTLGLTEARVSQIRSEALIALRAYFAQAFPELCDAPDVRAGHRARTAFLNDMNANTDWRSRLDAASPSLAFSA